MSPEIFINSKKLTIEDAFRLAQTYLETGRFNDLIDVCHRIVSADPTHFRAMQGIGLGLHNLGKTVEGLTYIRQAITLNPEYFSAYNNLGTILRQQGDFTGALDAFRKAEQLQPESVTLLINIGGVLKDLGSIDEAVSYFNKAGELAPENTVAMFGKAMCLHKKKEYEQARSTYATILDLKPDDSDTLYGIANLEVDMGLPEDAHHHFLQLLRIEPDNYNANLALANFLAEQVASHADWARDEVLFYYEKVAALKPEEDNYHNIIGNIYLTRGDIDGALQSFRKALRIDPGNPLTRSCILMTGQYHPSFSMEQLSQEAKLWPQFCTENIPRTTQYENNSDPDRLLKIGYVSGDFRMHPVGFHLIPAIYSHDPERFEIFCYDNNPTSDILSKRLKAYTENWRTINELNDIEVHDMIRNDGIDILIDLSGHTNGNRLRVFARKPAPLQVSWIGYFFTTGLPEIDYIIMDDTAVLPGEEEYFSETVIRLPQTRFCYLPPFFAGDVTAPPCIRNGYVTFGSFNNLAKVTAEVIELWAQILLSIPDARLLLKSAQLGSDGVKSCLLDQFNSLGIATERLILRGVSPHMEMLAEYGDMDIALDPFPFNGGMTSCEALWMGVPVLAMRGNRPISRQSASFLRAIGGDDFIAESKEDYLRKAVAWSNNTVILEELRMEMRQKMKNSLLCDGKRFTQNLEREFRKMWVQWCCKGSVDRSDIP